MKPIDKGWKEGVITEDLISASGVKHSKGSTVRYKKKLSIGDDKIVSKYQYHYIDLDNMNLVRSYRFLIEKNEQKDPIFS